MDDRHSKDSKASSDEGSSTEPPHNAGGRRPPYYECTFCKRGFSNAQALGGHMNIHRRDRRPPAAPLVQDTAAVIVEEAAEGYGYYCGQYANSYGAAAAFYQPAAYAMYLPASAALAAGYGGRQSARVRADDGVRAAPHEMSLFGGEEQRLGLSAGGERRQEVDESELDLELRLGHRP